MNIAFVMMSVSQVGIKGEEGVQAVNASDYAIAQFRYLTPLLLKHGRYNYIRMSNLVCYMFYKNILNSLTMFWFNFFCAFSGEIGPLAGARPVFSIQTSTGVFHMLRPRMAATSLPPTYLVRSGMAGAAATSNCASVIGFLRRGARGFLGAVMVATTA